MGFFDAFPDERTVLPAAYPLTPFTTAQVLRGLEGCAHDSALGDGLKIADLLVRLTLLPSPTDHAITARLLMFILSCWQQQDDPPMLHEAAVRDECSKLASVLNWLGAAVPPATTVGAVVGGIGRQSLISLSSGFRSVADRIEAECETRPKVVRWASRAPWWLLQSAAFQPWAHELARALGGPVQPATKTV